MPQLSGSYTEVNTLYDGCEVMKPLSGIDLGIPSTLLVVSTIPLLDIHTFNVDSRVLRPLKELHMVRMPLNVSSRITKAGVEYQDGEKENQD